MVTRTSSTAKTASEEPTVESTSGDEAPQGTLETHESLEEGAVRPDEAPDVTIQVEYVGEKPYGRTFVGRREIKRRDLKTIGIEHDSDLVFSPENGWRQSIPSSNTLLVEYFDKTDSGFKVL